MHTNDLTYLYKTNICGRCFICVTEHLSKEQMKGGKEGRRERNMFVRIKGSYGGCSYASKLIPWGVIDIESSCHSVKSTNHSLSLIFWLILFIISAQCGTREFWVATFGLSLKGVFIGYLKYYLAIVLYIKFKMKLGIILSLFVKLIN